MILIHEFVDIFTLKEYFIHLLDEPVDDVTWLRIQQPGTYSIHFDLIPIDPSSFSFELPTRNEIIHFSEHNPKHVVNLETGENCLLVYKKKSLKLLEKVKKYMFIIIYRNGTKTGIIITNNESKKRK